MNPSKQANRHNRDVLTHTFTPQPSFQPRFKCLWLNFSQHNPIKHSHALDLMEGEFLLAAGIKTATIQSQSIKQRGVK